MRTGIIFASVTRPQVVIWKVMEKAGFRKEGERIKAAYHDGAMKDRLEYAINKDEYLKSAVLDNITKKK
jgi:RimJ/RimL family protein N-acetyltransferase